MSGLFKYITVTSLIFAMAGAVLICGFAAALASGHEARDNMPLTHNGLSAHALHAKELTAVAAIANSLTSIIALLLAIALGVLFLFQKLGFLQPVAINQFAREHRDTPYLARRLIHSWLSLFEQSPNFIKPA